MPNRTLPQWSRRQFLQRGSLAALPTVMPPVLAKSVPKPLPPFSQFTDIAASAGLTQSIVYGTPGKVTYINESMGGGCAFFDYDNDGWMDIFIVGGRRLEGIPTGSGNHLYHNKRNGTFTDVTARSGLAAPGWGNGVCVGDFNNDGLEDLFITYFGQNHL